MASWFEKGFDLLKKEFELLAYAIPFSFGLEAEKQRGYEEAGVIGSPFELGAGKAASLYTKMQQAGALNRASKLTAAENKLATEAGLTIAEAEKLKKFALKQPDSKLMAFLKKNKGKIILGAGFTGVGIGLSIFSAYSGVNFVTIWYSLDNVGSMSSIGARDLIDEYERGDTDLTYEEASALMDEYQANAEFAADIARQTISRDPFFSIWGKNFIEKADTLERDLMTKRDRFERIAASKEREEEAYMQGITHDPELTSSPKGATEKTAEEFAEEQTPETLEEKRRRQDIAENIDKRQQRGLAEKKRQQEEERKQSELERRKREKQRRIGSRARTFIRI